MTRIEGFWIIGVVSAMCGRSGRRAETKYRFEVCADWNPIGKLWISPVDVADGYSVKDAERLATGARIGPCPTAPERRIRERIGLTPSAKS